LDISNYLFQAGKLGPWVSLFNQIMQNDPNIQGHTDNTEEIDRMNKTAEWKLKGIAS